MTDERVARYAKEWVKGTNPPEPTTEEEAMVMAAVAEAMEKAFLAGYAYGRAQVSRLESPGVT